MIKLQDAELISVLPPYLKNDTDVQAISYAYQMGMAKMLEYTRKTMLYANLDELPDEILDLLALEFRTQYYDQDMDIDTKRELIRNTLAWCMTAGTRAAVEELATTIFGDSSIVEWYEFTEGPYTPGTFDIVTNAQMTEAAVEDFLSVIQRVKNARSSIRRILIDREADLTVYAGLGAYASPHITITNSPQIEKTVSTVPRTAIAAVTATKTTVYNGAA